MVDLNDDRVLALSGVVVAALYLPLLRELRDTLWGGLIFATLVLGGVLFLLAFSLLFGEFAVKAMRYLKRRRTNPDARMAADKAGGRPMSRGLMVAISGLLVTLVVASVMMPVFATGLPRWEAFLAGFAVGGLVSVALGFLILASAMLIHRPSAGADRERSSSQTDLRPRWLRRAERWLFGLLLFFVLSIMLFLTGRYAFPIWPSFVLVAATAGLLMFGWWSLSKRWHLRA